MRVVLCGSPNWAYHDAVRGEIERLRRESRAEGKKLLIIHGNERGPERAAHEHCRKLGVDTIIQEAVKVLGGNCLYRRNELMLSYHKPDLVVCFTRRIGECPVVHDMIENARERGLKVRVVDMIHLRQSGESDQDNCYYFPDEM